MFRTVFVSFLAGMFIGVFASLKFIKKEVPVEVIKDRIVEVVRTEKSPNGQTVITKTITKDGYRFTEEYKEWRKKVFERDKFQCILCNSKTDIEADHIKPKSKYPELVYDIDNGRTLCKKCHKNTDTYGPSAIKVKRYDEVSELNNKTFKIKPLTWNTNILEGGVTASTYFGTIKIITIKKNRYSLTMSFEEFSQSKILLSDNLEDAKSYAENVWHGILLLHLEKC
jgi:hypothetical protein